MNLYCLYFILYIYEAYEDWLITFFWKLELEQLGTRAKN